MVCLWSVSNVSQCYWITMETSHGGPIVTSSLYDNMAFELASGFLQPPTNVGAIGYALLGEAFWAKWKNNVCDLERAFEQETKSFKLQ